MSSNWITISIIIWWLWLRFKSLSIFPCSRCLFITLNVFELTLHGLRSMMVSIGRRKTSVYYRTLLRRNHHIIIIIKGCLHRSLRDQLLIFNAIIGMRQCSLKDACSANTIKIRTLLQRLLLINVRDSLWGTFRLILIEARFINEVFVHHFCLWSTSSRDYFLWLFQIEIT